MFRIRLVASAAKEFKQLESGIRDRVIKSIDSLQTNPRPHGVTKLKGHQRLYRIRVGVWRNIYEIRDKDNLILITRIRHRSEAYQ